MATCALPIVCPPVELDGQHYVDGSIADPIPFAHLLEKGCDKILVILTGGANSHPTDYRKLKPLLWQFYAKSYPKLYAAILHRIAVYQEEIQKMCRAQQNGQVFVLRPQIAPISLFTQNPEKIIDYYQHGKNHLEHLLPELEHWLSVKSYETAWDGTQNSIFVGCTV